MRSILGDDRSTPWARLWPKLFPASGQGLRARRPDRGPEAGPRCPDPASFGVQANCGRVRHALGRPRAAAFAWMVPGEFALFGLDELERDQGVGRRLTLLLGQRQPAGGLSGWPLRDGRGVLC